MKHIPKAVAWLSAQEWFLREPDYVWQLHTNRRPIAYRLQRANIYSHKTAIVDIPVERIVREALRSRRVASSQKSA